jgi:cyclopropane fatty-acyl-phospholipid synthase-like methyltransferase
MTKALLAVAAFTTVGLASATAQQAQKPHDQHMHHRFDDPERYAKSFDDPARDAWQMPDHVIDVLKVAPDAAIADIGAGTGYFTMRLATAAANGTVYAVDIEDAMLDHIRKRAAAASLANVVTVKADPSSANLPKPVDLVLVVDTYHHIPNRPSYFRALAASLAADGRVAIIDFRKDSPEGPPPEFRFEVDQIVQELKDAGFRVDTKHDFLPRQHFLVFRPESPAR